MRVSLLLLCLFSYVSPDETPHLRKITLDLSVISHLMDGIYIQNALLDKKITENQVMAESFKLKSPKILDDLKDIQFMSISGKIDELSTIRKNLGNSSIFNYQNLWNNLNDLPQFLNQTEVLEKASDVNLTEEFRSTVSEITGPNKFDLTNTFLEKLSLNSVLESLSLILDETILSQMPTDDVEVSDIKKTIRQLTKKTKKQYMEFVDQLKKYEADLDKLLNFGKINVEDVLGPVKYLRDFAETYDGSKVGNDELKNGLISMSSDVDQLESVKLLESQSLLKELQTSMDTLFPQVVELRNGKHRKSINFNFNEKVILEKLAEGEQKYVDKLKGAMSFFGKFAEKSDIVFIGFGSFLNETRDDQDVNSIQRISSKSAESLATIEAVKNSLPTLKTTTNASLACLNSQVNFPRKNISFADFDEVYQFSKDLQEKINKIQSLIKEILGNSELENFSIFDEMTAAIAPEIKKVSNRMTPDQAWSTIEAMRKVPNAKEFLGNITEIDRLFKEAQNSQIEVLLEKTLDFDIVVQIQNVLSDTGLIPALRCLKDLDPTLNTEEAQKLMNFSQTFRKLENSDMETTKKIIGKVEKIRNDLESLKSVSRVKRDAADNGEKELKKLENSETISKELRNGVEGLEKMVEVIDKKSVVLAAINFDDEVNNEIVAIQSPPMQTIWTSENRQKLENIFKDVDQLDKVAELYGKQNFTEMFGILKNATSLDGVAIDSNVFKDPVSVQLAASSNPKVQSAATTFEELSTLNLNFASFHDPMTKAASTANTIRNFFDSFFGIDRSPITTTSKPSNVTEEDAEAMAQEQAEKPAEKKGIDMMYIILAAIAVLLVVIIPVVVICCIKRKNYNAKLNDRETWRHLRFLDEGKLKKDDGTEYTPLHLAVVKKNFNALKKQVENGGFVDVHSYGKIVETPLHTAVSKNLPNFVEFLLKKGADKDALDSNYETPVMRAKKNKEMERIFDNLGNKKYKKTLPHVLPTNKYKVFIDKKVKGAKDFKKTFKENVVDEIDKATHVVVKTEKDGSFEMSNEDESYLTFVEAVCSPRMLISDKWLDASVKKNSDFRDDFKFRVKQIKFNGKTYKTLDEIQLANSKMHIPYLKNAIIYFDQATLHTINWDSLKKTASELGAEIVEDFPLMQGALPGKPPFYRDDLGHIFVVYMEGNAENLTKLYPVLKTDKAYNFLNRDEFIDLILSQKVDNKNVKKQGRKEKKDKTPRSKSVPATPNSGTPSETPSGQSTPNSSKEPKSDN